MRDLAGPLQVGEHSDLILERNLPIDAMKLEQLDALEMESAQAHLHLLA